MMRFATLCFMLLSAPCFSQDKVKHQVLGLFMPEREEDLRVTFEKIEGVKLVSIDYKNAEAVFEYDVKKVFANGKPDQVIQRFDNLLRGASNGTFGIKPLRTAPLEKLKWIEIPVAGLDCKACSLVAYECIFKLEGVEQATASFKAGLVTALIDPEKTDRAKLEAALKKKGVTLR